MVTGAMFALAGITGYNLFSTYAANECQVLRRPPMSSPEMQKVFNNVNSPVVKTDDSNNRLQRFMRKIISLTTWLISFGQGFPRPCSAEMCIALLGYGQHVTTRGDRSPRWGTIRLCPKRVAGMQWPGALLSRDRS